MAFSSHKTPRVLVLYMIPAIAFSLDYITRSSLLGENISNSTSVVGYYVLLVYWLLYAVVVTLFVLLVSNHKIFQWTIGVAGIFWLLAAHFYLLQ